MYFCGKETEKRMTDDEKYMQRCIQFADGSQKCHVRALGGTVDIAITVGGVSWRKGSESYSYCIS